MLRTLRNSTTTDAENAIRAAAEAAPGWQAMPFDERCAIIRKSADLLARPWRQRLNAATMLGQSKTAFRAEIDATCELIDFWRFNVHYASQVLTDQPIANSRGVWNRTDHPPLGGFVYAITPFNFTAIAGNLPTAPAPMGNTVLWRPSPAQQLAASLTMELLDEAGMPPGVINMLPGDGHDVSKVALAHRDLTGIHFTGSTSTFQHLRRTVGENIQGYCAYPRIVGETGDKDFIVADPSADPDVLRVAMIRGAFEFQGQKCSAASRVCAAVGVGAHQGPARRGHRGAVDGRRHRPVSLHGCGHRRPGLRQTREGHRRVKVAYHLTPLAGGQTDDSVGFFVRPTIVESADRTDQMFSEECFGTLLAVHVHEDVNFESVVTQMESFPPYALTVAITAQDRSAIAWAGKTLRFAAGHFYINDKPTGAVVGQQPFGAVAPRASTTRPAPRSTCCAGPRRGRSRRPSCL